MFNVWELLAVLGLVNSSALTKIKISNQLTKLRIRRCLSLINLLNLLTVLNLKIHTLCEHVERQLIAVASEIIDLYLYVASGVSSYARVVKLR
jgi:hypothetical protein